MEWPKATSEALGALFQNNLDRWRGLRAFPALYGSYTHSHSVTHNWHRCKFFFNESWWKDPIEMHYRYLVTARNVAHSHTSYSSSTFLIYFEVLLSVLSRKLCTKFLPIFRRKGTCSFTIDRATSTSKAFTPTTTRRSKRPDTMPKWLTASDADPCSLSTSTSLLPRRTRYCMRLQGDAKHPSRC